MTDFDNITDIDDEIDVLGDLEDLFDDLPIDDPNKTQMYSIYGVFIRDFNKNPIEINGIQLTFNKDKSKHPICRGKEKAFEHIITRENKHNKKREFDHERANKIHWIKPIIENVHDARIKYFEMENEDGFNQQYYWYEERSFIVIIREIKPDYLLITSFSIDHYEKVTYKKRYDTYRS